MRLGTLAAPGLVVLLIVTASACGPRPPRSGGAWSERGVASWYGPGFHGRQTANGERYDMEAMTAAHKTLPFGTMVEVRNLDNGRTARVRINDRGPFVRGRIIDLSRAAARAIEMLGPGTARVEIRAELPARTDPSVAYTVQVGAFRDRSRAVELAARLQRHYDARIVTEGRLHRVRVGGDLSARKARELAARLRRDGYEAVVVGR